MSEKKFWIDAVKAICMIGVYLINYGYFVTPFYVNAFFFIRGYLLYNTLIHCDLIGGGDFESLKNTCFRLIIPMILF